MFVNSRIWHSEIWCYVTDRILRNKVDSYVKYTGWGKSGFTVLSMWNTVYSCIINYHIIFHMNTVNLLLPHLVCEMRDRGISDGSI